MEKPVRPSFARLAIAVAVPLIVLLAVYYAANGDLSNIGGRSLRLSAETPSSVTLATDGATPVTVTLTLTNRTAGVIQLGASDPCKVLRWVVQAPEDVFVQSKGSECGSDEMTRTIGSGETIERSETISLDTRRYTAGVTYTLFVQFYGQDATAQFTAE